MKRSRARLLPGSRGSACAGQITSAESVSEVVGTQPGHPESQRRQRGAGMTVLLWGFLCTGSPGNDGLGGG